MSAAPDHLVPLLDRLLDPPLQTAHLPGIGGLLRRRPDDFAVRELPAYPPDGRPGHLFLLLRKRGLTTEDALAELSRQLDIPRPEIGLAGLKDRDAVTEQWVSLPASAGPRLPLFRHQDMSLGTPHPHSHKLRRGHLHGNHFTIIVRDLSLPPEGALARARAKLDLLRQQGGLDNLYGSQRLGDHGNNILRGLQALARAKRRARADFLLSAGQSALFNLYLLERRARGLSQRVLLGDILKKTDTGGLFTCTDPDTDNSRLAAGALLITGPMFGSKMRAPDPGTPSGQLEAEILARAEIDPSIFQALGHTLEGTRRPLQVPLGDIDLTLEHHGLPPWIHPAQDPQGSPLSQGISLSFTLPAGSYATSLLREIQLPA